MHHCRKGLDAKVAVEAVKHAAQVLSSHVEAHGRGDEEW